MSATYCPQLWDGFYINREGDVYPCCHQNPHLIGNINTSHLRQIVNSDRAQKARLESLNGELHCYFDCTLLDKDRDNGSPVSKHFVEYSTLRRLHISFGEACNIRCIMCSHPLRHLENPLVLEADTVVRNVDITPFREIVIQGGEPLFVKQCLKYMKFLEDIGKRYTLLTNGLLINEKMAYRLAEHASVISISINGGSKVMHEKINFGSTFERVLHNIQLLISARRDLKSDMTINGRMTITPQNVTDVPIFISKFRRMGFDRVNFGFVKKTVPAYLRTHPDVLARIREEIEFVSRTSNLDLLDTLRLKQLGLMAWHTRTS